MVFPSTESHFHNHTENHHITRFIQSTSSNFFSLFSPFHPTITKTTSTPPPLSLPSCIPTSSSSICVPFSFPDAPSPPKHPILSLSTTPTPSSSSSQKDTLSSNSQIKSMPSGHNSPYTSSLKTTGFKANSKDGPAFVGQVFSLCDVSGTGLMAVTSHFQIPFLSQRTQEWFAQMLSKFNKSENNGPVFRFFMDIGDAVSYVKRLNIPNGVVGACRLDLAYERFKEEPHMFQFVPNEKQVKAANKLLKKIPHDGGRRRVDGVPVFTAQNLEIAVATSDGIKRYTPYFFDKNMLDNILEESVDQHFHSLIQIRHRDRWKDVVDDNLTAEVVEDIADTWEPPEVQEVLDEMGNPGIPLSVISKAAEMQLLHTVDKVLLGNRWLRKATGIQPKFPYRVDSFEKRSAASFLKASVLTSTAANKEVGSDTNDHTHLNDPSELKLGESTQGGEMHVSTLSTFQFPFGFWFPNPWSKQRPKQDKQIMSDSRSTDRREKAISQSPPNPFLPQITMIGISTGETGELSKANLKKVMKDLTEELEQPLQNRSNSSSDEVRHEDRDPMFVSM